MAISAYYMPKTKRSARN